MAAHQVHRLGQRHRGQLGAADDVAQGQHRGHRALETLVDLDVAAVVELNPQRLQAQPLEVRAAAGGGEHRIHLQGLAAGEGHHQAALDALDALDVGVEAQVDALRGHLVTGELAHLAVEAAQEQLAAVDQVGLAAQAIEDAGELHGDIAAAQHQEALGEVVEVEHLVGAQRKLAARELGDPGPAAHRHQDLRGAVHLVAHRDAMGIQYPGPGVDQADPGAIQQARIDAVEALDLAYLVVAQGRPVEDRWLVEPPAEALGILEGVMEVGGVGVELLGHAAHVDAGAAQVAVLRHGHAGAGGGGGARRPDAAGAGADHEEVPVVGGGIEVGHGLAPCGGPGPGVGCGDDSSQGRHAA